MREGSSQGVMSKIRLDVDYQEETGKRKKKASGPGSQTAIASLGLRASLKCCLPLLCHPWGGDTLGMASGF